MPKVSICCSVLNQSAWLEDMIASVFAQSLQDWELIIVDDGSTEDIPAVIAKFNDQFKRVSYHRFEENKGIPFGVNWAFEHATGEYVQPLAADELLDMKKLEQQVAYLDEHSEIQAVFGLPGNGKTGERPEWEQYACRAANRSREQWLATLLNIDAVPIGGAGALWRRTVFDEIGYFDEKLTAFSDHEWFVRFFERFEGRILPYRWALSRPNPGAVSRSTEAVISEIQYVREKHPLHAPRDNGLVTVVIPCFNYGRFIRHAIESVRKQTYQQFQIVIVDDASTDDSLKLIRKYLDKVKDDRISLHLLLENKGCHNAVNYALSWAKGDYFVTLSADDTLAPDFLQKCLVALSADSRREFVASQTDFIAENGAEHKTDHPLKQIEPATNKSQEMWFARLRYGNVYFGGGMYLTRTLRELGGWDPQWKVLGDYEMYLRLVQRWNLTIIEEPLTHTRIHSKQQSFNCDPQWLAQTYHDIKAKYYPPRQKVIIATAFYESRGYAPYIASLLHTVRLLEITGIAYDFRDVCGDAYVDRAKNTLMAQFLDDPDATDLFMIDSDMSWNPVSFLNMLQTPEEIVVGSYPMKNNWEVFTSVPYTEEVEKGKLATIGRILEDGTGLLQGAVLSGGFMRFKRSALEKYRDHYKDLWYRDKSADPRAPERKYTAFFHCELGDGVRWGEDRFFSRQLEKMGQKWFIYTNVDFGHFGIKGFYGNFDQYLRAQDKVAA